MMIHTKAASLPAIPPSVKEEHEELHEALATATRLRGPVGKAAHAVATTLHPHFVREEEIALPPLGLLRLLAEGNVAPEMAAVLPLTDALLKELPTMLEQHRRIASVLRQLQDVAEREEAPEVQQLARRIALHARSEEEVFYPAAILVGEVVRKRLHWRA